MLLSFSRTEYFHSECEYMTGVALVAFVHGHGGGVLVLLHGAVLAWVHRGCASAHRLLLRYPFRMNDEGTSVRAICSREHTALVNISFWTNNLRHMESSWTTTVLACVLVLRHQVTLVVSVQIWQTVILGGHYMFPGQW